MTDQYQWQGALAAAEYAIRAEQFDEAVISLQLALTHISLLERNDPTRLSILDLFMRCCIRATELSAKQSRLQMQRNIAEARHVIALAGGCPPLTMRQAFAQLPDDSIERRRRGRTNRRLHNYHVDAGSMLLDSQIAQNGEDSAEVVSTLLTLDRLEWEHGREDESFDLLRRALSIRERTLGTEHPDTLLVAGRLASHYDAWTIYERAIPLWQRLLTYVEQVGPLDHFSLPQLLALLGKAYCSVHLYREAKRTWKRFLALTEQDAQQEVAGIPTMKFARLNICYGIGYACLAQEEWAEAASFLAFAVASHRTLPGFTVNGELIAGGITLASGIAPMPKR